MEKSKRENKRKIEYLALGDSYTIGEAVEREDSFPAQLSMELESDLELTVKPQIIATTGWRTDQLIEAIEKADLNQKYDFITLLIGVNNQFQNKDFSQYEKEFVELLSISVDLVNGFKDNILVLSIPDYGFTPFGKDREGVSEGVDRYNNFAEKASTENGIDFLNITDITRRGLKEPELIASDNLHISAVVYKEIVARILQKKQQLFEKLK